MGYSTSYFQTFEETEHEILKLKEEAAVKAFQAAKFHVKKGKCEEKLARLHLKRMKYQEERDRLIERGKFFETQAKEWQRKGKSNSSGAAVEINAKQKKDKAKRLRKKAKLFEIKIARIEQVCKELLERSREYDRRREELMVESKKLEAKAINIERSL